MKQLPYACTDDILTFGVALRLNIIGETDKPLRTVQGNLFALLSQDLALLLEEVKVDRIHVVKYE